MDIKVLHVANSGFFVDRLLKGKLDGLCRFGVDAHVAAPAHKDGRVAVSRYFPLEIAREISPVKDAAATAGLAALLSKNDFNLCHTHSSKAGFIGRAAARIAGVPCVHSVHGLPFYDGQGKFEHALYKRLEGFASRRCHCILTQNHEELEVLKREFALPRHMLFYEGNGLDVTSTASYARFRPSERKRLGLGDDIVLIGVFARFEPVKDHFLFLRAFERLAALAPNVCAVFAGGDLGLGGEYAEKLTKAVEASPAGDRITVAGFIKDPLPLMSACDMVALTSKKEGLPRCIMEAMSLGIPVAATDVTGTRELVRHGATGLLSGYGDDKTLCKNMLALASDADMRSRFGAAALRFAAAELDESHVIKRIVNAYRFVIDSNRRST